MVRHQTIYHHFYYPKFCSDILSGHLKDTISGTEFLSSIFFVNDLLCEHKVGNAHDTDAVAISIDNILSMLLEKISLASLQ